MGLKRSHLGPHSPHKRIGGVEIFGGSISLGGWPIRPGATLPGVSDDDRGDS